MTYHTRNSGEQVRYRMRNWYEQVWNSSHMWLSLCVQFVTQVPNFSWYRLLLLEIGHIVYNRHWI